ncbi:MAG: hypothetical protein ACI9X4_000063 [Glaciecola sp.]|jgi:hypothetical protein
MTPAPESLSTPENATAARAWLCNRVMMVRPALFEWNKETSKSNKFQITPSRSDANLVHDEAIREFDDLRDTLLQAGIEVHSFDDDPSPATPDSIFPNNWVSFHADGTVILYPMQAPNRRAEVRTEWVDQLQSALQVSWNRRIDLRYLCDQGHFLEGTGSLILDRKNKVAYAALSSRTTREGLEAFSLASGFTIHSLQTSVEGFPIYHTNVMMSLGPTHAVVCMQAIPSKQAQDELQSGLESSGRQILEIDRDQMLNFAGNQLTLANAAGDPQIVMSKRALASLRPSQVGQLEGHGQILAPCLMTIEHHGGGSARCMLAEIPSAINSIH